MNDFSAKSDAHWMRLALTQAHAAAQAGEVPVGAVVVHSGQIIGTGHNAPIRTHDPSAHAEMVALRQAASHLGNYRLEDCELFVTLEPCPMCAGAMLQARFKRVVFGAFDPKTGACGSVINLFAHAQLNHQTQIEGGVLMAECGVVLSDFFERRRALKAINAVQLREDALRTPASAFGGLVDLAVPSVWLADLPGLEGLQLHYLDAGTENAQKTYLCLHGINAWSEQWRGFLAAQRAQGNRALAPDLIGFGRSDKPKKLSWHQLQRHADILAQWIGRLNLQNLTLVEPHRGAFADPVTGQRLADLLMVCAPDRIVGRQYADEDTLNEQALNAPYPDAGHRAALRAFDPPNKS